MPSSQSGYESGQSPRAGARSLLIGGAVILAVLVAAVVVLGLVDVTPEPRPVEKVVTGDWRSR